MDSIELYRRLGRLLEKVPDFSGYAPLNQEQIQWLARAGALVDASGDVSVQLSFNVEQSSVARPATRADSLPKLLLTLHRLLAAAELKVPAAAQGAFIPANNAFDAFAALTKVLQTAKSDLLIVDPYMDETLLIEFAASVPESVAIRLLADEASVKASLNPAATRWKAQFATRSLAVRLSPPKGLHDRAIFVDGTTAWTLTQSIKDFAKRSPAEIVRADDIAALKIPAYEAIWHTARVVV